LHWDKVSDGPWVEKPRGNDIETFIRELKSLPEGTCFRHNQAGDLPSSQGIINIHAFGLIANACHERKLTAWTYTHHDLTHYGNREIVKQAPEMGMTVNASAHSQSHAAELHKQGIPSVCIVPKNEHRKTWEHDGVKFLVCPAQWSDKNCAECKLCSVADRKCVVAFKAPGTQAKKVEATIA
jgi:hypothetical protein